MPSNNRAVDISETMAAYLRRRLGGNVPLYREIVLWDDGTFQVKAVHTSDDKNRKRRICLMYTSGKDEYKLIEGLLQDYAAESWQDTTVELVPKEDVES